MAQPQDYTPTPPARLNQENLLQHQQQFQHQAPAAAMSINQMHANLPE
jgi:hypothetical protein